MCALLQDINFTVQWTTTATQYAISPKAINVSTAACMFKILIRKSPHKTCLPTNSEDCQTTCQQLFMTAINSDEKFTMSAGGCGSDNKLASLNSQTCQLDLADNEGGTSTPCIQAFRLLSQFVSVLKSQIKVARKSLLQAAFEAPIHGVLYCIREVICDLELRLEKYRISLA